MFTTRSGELPSLPPLPTQNSLQPSQRSRLIRSTRKLGAILGATPQLLERTHPLAFVQQQHHRRARSDSCTSPPSTASTPRSSTDSFVDLAGSSTTTRTTNTPASSVSSLHAAKIFPTPLTRSLSLQHGSTAKLHKRHPVPLLLVLDTTGSSCSGYSTASTTSLHDHDSSSSCDAFFDAPPLRAPLSPIPEPEPSTPGSTTTTFTISTFLPPLPPSPTSQVARRRKMDKLKRHLGENVPPDLVFPPSSSELPRPDISLPKSNKSKEAKPKSLKPKKSPPSSRSPQGFVFTTHTHQHADPVPLPKPVSAKSPTGATATAAAAAMAAERRRLAHRRSSRRLGALNDASNPSRRQSGNAPLPLPPRSPSTTHIGDSPQQQQQRQRGASSRSGGKDRHADARRLSAPGLNPRRQSVARVPHHHHPQQQQHNGAGRRAGDVDRAKPEKDSDAASWIGEWNVQDIKQVQKALRGLKGK